MTREKLKIIEVKPIQEFGKGGKKLIFRANDGQHDLKYITFRSSLFEHIKVDANLEVDLEVTTREYEGETYTDRKVMEIYLDGKPVGGEAKGGGRQWGRSAEELASIERQVAVKEVGECFRMGKLGDDHPLVAIYLKCLTGWLGVEYKVEKEKTKPPGESASKEAKAEWTSPINEEWLRTSLKTLQKKGKKPYYDPAIISYLDTITKPTAPSKSITEAVSRLSSSQAEDFTKTIETALLS